jgi:hypothetical protein
MTHSGIMSTSSTMTHSGVPSTSGIIAMAIGENVWLYGS